MTSTQSERYVCQLESGFIKKAKDELNENESDRLSAIDALRNWLQEQKHVKFHTGKIIVISNYKYFFFT